MGMSPEARAAASARAKARWAALKAAEAGTATAVAPVKEAGPDDDVLAQLAAAFTAAAGKKGERAAHVREIEDLLLKLDPKTHPELLDSPVVLNFLEELAERKATANPDDPPGTIYNAGTLAATKKPWTWRDIAGAASVSFVPTETIPLIYNGLRVVVVGGEENTVPKPFYDIYMEHRRAQVTAEQHAAMLFRGRNVIDGRADPSVIGPATSRVRASGEGNTGYRPGAGMFPVGAAEEAEEAPVSA